MGLIDSLETTYQSLQKPPRDKSKAEGNEVVVAHPDGRHGIFVRDDGSVDVVSGSQSIGVHGNGLVGDLKVMDFQTSVWHLRTNSMWIFTERDGLIIDGYVPDYGIIHGELIARYLRDAKVVIRRGSTKRIQKRRGEMTGPDTETPVSNDPRSCCYPLAYVSLSSLIEPFPWSRQLDQKVLQKFKGVLNRATGGSSS